MNQLTQGLPKRRGGAREGSGRKRAVVNTQTIRVATGIADACKSLDAHYREMISSPVTEQAVLISLDDRAMVVRTTEEQRLIAKRLVDRLLSTDLAGFSEQQKKNFLAVLLQRLFDMYPDAVIYPYGPDARKRT